MRFTYLTQRICSFVGFAVLAAGSGCGGTDATSLPPASNPATETYAPALGVNIASMTKLADDLYIQDLVIGSGTIVPATHLVSVTYTGWLANGTQFDSNVGGTPLPFTLGAGQVIPGWDQGLLGMRVGGKRLLVIGSALAYGSVAHGAIPASSTLVFTVLVNSVQ